MLKDPSSLDTSVILSKARQGQYLGNKIASRQRRVHIKTKVKYKGAHEASRCVMHSIERRERAKGNMVQV